MSKDLASEEQVAQEKALLKKVEERQKADLKYLLATPEFRRLMWRWLSKAQIKARLFTPDPYDLAYRVGASDFGKSLLEELEKASPEMVFEMSQEASKGV